VRAQSSVGSWDSRKKWQVDCEPEHGNRGQLQRDSREGVLVCNVVSCSVHKLVTVL
jgi:hypothetical protein